MSRSSSKVWRQAEGFFRLPIERASREKNDAVRRHRTKARNDPRLHGQREHVPVTVLRSTAVRSSPIAQEKNGYIAFSSASARQGQERLQGRTRPLRRGQGRAEAEARGIPRRGRRSVPIGAEITADHFVVGQFVDVTGTTTGKGFAGPMKRWNFGGLRATHGVSVSHRSHGSTGGRQDPGKTFKNKKMAGHMGVDRVTTQNLRVVQLDVERGLVLVEGAVPGARRRLDLCPRRGEEGAPEGRAEARQVPLVEDARLRAEARLRPKTDGGLSREDRHHFPRRRESRLDRTRRTTFSASSPARTDRPHGALPARQAPRRHACGQEPRGHRPHRQEDVQAEGHRLARHGSARVPQFRGGGRAFGPVVRSPCA